MFDSHDFTYMGELLETVAGVFPPDPEEQRGDSNKEGHEPLDVLRRHSCPGMQAQAPSTGCGLLKCAWIIRARENQGNVPERAYRHIQFCFACGL